jgi:hypothetical protein
MYKLIEQSKIIRERKNPEYLIFEIICSTYCDCSRRKGLIQIVPGFRAQKYLKMKSSIFVLNTNSILLSHNIPYLQWNLRRDGELLKKYSQKPNY